MASEMDRMQRISQVAALIAALTLASGAALAAPCPETDRGTLEEWKCYGEVVYASRIEGEDEFGARFVVFANGERLYEKREPALAKARLMGEGWRLYRGFEREDSTVIGRHDPFLFFEFALVTPLIALAASGVPPGLLPAGTTPVAYTVDSQPIDLMREIGIRSVRGSIERSGEDYVFAAESTGNVPTGLLALSVRGRWSAQPVEPFPDSMPVSGWRYHCPPAGVDVRGNHRPVPPGVTLGDVRRG
jgi:hypothetical protein